MRWSIVKTTTTVMMLILSMMMLIAGGGIIDSLCTGAITSLDRGLPIISAVRQSRPRCFRHLATCVGSILGDVGVKGSSTPYC
ncbi:uncharacterized protein BP01DRAFT_106436 [Aspergillus saccharolyticus JOP 1030-1]|uniref:Uncharacterized protein n=1 Tax=Aspergillus saccharolyticus JOP 1030-1 TaxID=1450539 RepID=A0A318ZF35_9EURO|nr:hypothetical protein BP01DRAFT_106436 [Aspergillus saccharolyticus JOP 1030-1]PYH43253.1 hypothetical protein BP01DRAFT_106436 [Aspergillus saccharolyticus JOP 1030-1]